MLRFTSEEKNMLDAEWRISPHYKEFLRLAATKDHRDENYDPHVRLARLLFLLGVRNVK